MPLTGLTHDMLPREKFDIRCSEMLCSGHVFASEKMTSARGLGSNVQFNMAAPFQGCRDFAKHNDCSVSLWSAKRLLILTTNTEERQKQLTVNTLQSHLLQKNVLLFAFDIDLLVDTL